MENIEQRVKKIVAEQLGVNEAEIKNESSFVDDLGADSLDTVELVMALEEEFETEIPGRRRRENHHGPAGHRLHRRPPQEVIAAAPAVETSSPAALPGGSAGRPAPRQAYLRRPQLNRHALMTRRRVVVTGLGIISPVGIGVADAWDEHPCRALRHRADHALRRVGVSDADRRRSQELRRRQVPVGQGSAALRHVRPLRAGGDDGGGGRRRPRRLSRGQGTRRRLHRLRASAACR